MKIIVSQQDNKLSIEFQAGKLIDKYVVDKAEDFLVCVDKLIRKRRISPIGLIGQTGYVEFHNTGVLTERVARAIIGGLSFFHNKKIVSLREISRSEKYHN